MDEFGKVSHNEASSVPDQLRGLFNQPDDVRVQRLPRAGLEDRGSMAVFFGAGARTVPHTHHLFISDGVGVIGDDKGVHVVGAGDVVSSPPGGWHWHGATPTTAMTHLTVEQPGDFDLDVDRRDWDTTYDPELGA
jgi:quercetin dioxygenase-like cupin family protein